MARPIPNNSSTRWTIRLIPLFIVAAIGFAKYVVIAHVCVDYIYTQRNQQDLAAALMTLYCVFFTLTVLSYARTFYAAHTKPGLVPLSDKRRDALRRREERRNNPNTKREADDLEEAEEPDWMPVDMNPDSPGLERFYSKQIFTCEPDGRPRWCTLCWNWKPDRASHSTELGRCVRKMDHLCPWVGGMVAENSFNFFFQFTIYCTLYLSVCLATTSYALRKQIHEGKAVDGRIIAVMALSGLFLFFTIGMALTSGKYIFENITNIDVLRSSAYHYVAVRIPTNSPPGGFNRISYPLPLPGSEEEYAQINGFTIVGREMSPVNTFAIVRTNPGENVFDLGPWRNFKAIMGNNLFEWMFPVRHSPCCDHDSMTSDYEYGPLIDELKKRHKLPGPDDFAPRHSNPPGFRAPAISILDEH